MDDDDDDDALVAPTTLVAELPPPPPVAAAAAPLVVVVGGDVDPKAPPGFWTSRRSEDRVRAWTPSEDISLNYYYGEEMV